MYGLVANVVSDRVLRTGARVWILRCNGDASCPIVTGRSKGGRIVQKYTHYKRLTNFRSAWIPEHMRGRVEWKWEGKAEAAGLAATLGAMWAGIRQYSRDGKVLVRDGEPESAAFERARID
jgi:hypothetical protein